MDKKHTWNVGYWLVALMLLSLVQDLWHQVGEIEAVSYSAFEKALAEGRVAEVTITDQAITGRLKVADGTRTLLVATRVEPELAARLEKFGVPYTRVVANTFLRDLLSWIVPGAVFFGLWYFVFRRFASQQGGLGGFMSIGKSRAKVYVETNTGVTFADVAGVDEAKAELEEVVDFLQHPQEYGRLGAHIPKGVLLVGPPGTGKTLLAKAVAGQAGVAFFSISGSEFVEMFVGVGAARVRDLFEQARQLAPAIIFIDELDALGRARGAFPGLGGHDEKEQTLNQLLVEMDGFDTSVGLIILAATNRPEILDPALLRAGRFDRQVLVDRPDKLGRIDILKVHVRQVHLAAQVALDEVAALTPGFSGADLANLVNEAALLATRRKATEVTLGHALVALAQPGTDPVHKVSIIPRGVGALGYTLQRPTEDRYLMTRHELERKIAVLLGGRAAEKLVFGELSTGAADDLAKATDIARDMVTRYGMDEGLGYIAYETARAPMLDGLPTAPHEHGVSEDTRRRIDEAIRGIVMAGFERATAILVAHRAVLDRSARALLERETLDEAALVALTADLPRDG